MIKKKFGAVVAAVVAAATLALIGAPSASATTQTAQCSVSNRTFDVVVNRTANADGTFNLTSIDVNRPAAGYRVSSTLIANGVGQLVTTHGNASGPVSINVQHKSSWSATLTYRGEICTTPLQT